MKLGSLIKRTEDLIGGHILIYKWMEKTLNQELLGLSPKMYSYEEKEQCALKNVSISWNTKITFYLDIPDG
jgi:hypothetical protein